MKTAAEIEDRLPYFTGTDNWYKYAGGIVLTDGVKYLAESAECFWLLDIIASYQPQCRKDKMLHDMQFWKLTVDLEKKSARVVCERDTKDVAITQDVEFTDFPLTSATIWVEFSGDGTWVALLPSEH